METCYVIDAEDRIESFTPGRASGAAEASIDWRGRSIWSVLSGDATGQIYRRLVRRVRGDRALVTFQYRCDLAHQRRWFEMSIESRDGQRVEFRSRLLSVSPRPPVGWLESVTGYGPPVVLCSWCGQVLHQGEWLEIEHAAPVVPDSARLEHGICPACAVKFTSEFAAGQK